MEAPYEQPWKKDGSGIEESYVGVRKSPLTAMAVPWRHHGSLVSLVKAPSKCYRITEKLMKAHTPQ